MKVLNQIFLTITLFLVISCSSSYNELSTKTFKSNNKFSQSLFDFYKEKSIFEANEMHDWNSAKLYSEKALLSTKEINVLPQEIKYWKIPPKNQAELIKSYKNLMLIYEDAIIIDPFNLAKAVSSLDCWSEQQEENWQTWDIKKCRNDFLNAMHLIYNSINDITKSKLNLENKLSEKNNGNSTLTTLKKDNNIMQIIYFDFDKFKLNSVNIIEIKNFITSNKKIIDEYLVVGHTDTVGTSIYNHKLSIRRAQEVKNILISLGIQANKIKILGKGEDNLLIKTKDEVEYPLNRRAEISPLN